MADDLALQGPHPHLANGSRGRSNLLPYQPHGFTGYEPNRPASMPSTPRRHGEAPGPPRVNPIGRAGMPASGSGTQAPALVLRMLREVVHLHRGDEEASRERYMYEQQEAFDAAAQREHQHTELEEIAGSLRAELNLQAEQHLNHFLLQEQACYNFHLRNVESHLQAEVANTRFHLQQEYLVRTTEVEERAAASESAYAAMHRELLEQRDQLQANQAHLMEGGLHLQGQYTEHVQQLRRELQEAQHQRMLDSESGTASRQIIQRERAIHQRNLAEQAEKWKAHSLEIFDEGRAAISTHRQEILAERDIISQLQEHLAETQAQVDDWNFWYDQEYVSEYDMVQEDQDEDEAAEANQVQPLMQVPQQSQSTPITPPVVQGHVPAELLPPTQIPSFVMTPLPQVQQSTAIAPPPPPPGPPPSEESPQQVSQPVVQQPSQPEPSVPSQQSLPSTHRCPEVQGVVSPMTQEYVPGRAQLPPMTPAACLNQDIARVPIAPVSPPGYLGGMQPGSPPRASPPPPQPPVGDGSAWSYVRQMYRSSPHAAQAVEVQPLPTSAGVSEPSLYQHSQASPHYQWAAGSTAGASTSLSNAGAFPAVAVNTGSGAPAAPDGSGGIGSQPHSQQPIQPRAEQPISKNKSPLPKLNIRGGDPTTLTRIINEWIQKTAIALNTWSIEASNFWNQSVNTARQQHNWWLSLAPQDRAMHIGMPASFQALPTQVPVLEATMRAELINSVLPEKVTSMAMQKGALKVPELLFLTFQTFLPSEPSARVDGLNTVESPLKAAKNFAEALSTLRTWRQQVVTVVTDLKANPEPLKLFNSLRILISNITSSDNAFATEVSQMYRSTQIKTSCTDRALMEFMNLLEIEMSHRAMEDDEDRRRRGQANMATSSSHSPPDATDAAANAVGKGGRKGKGKPKSGGKGEKRTVCQEYLSDKGCPKGDQCPHAHPRKAGKCLRCGATGHELASCRRPAKDPRTKGSPPPPKGQGRGKGKAKAKPKPKAKAQAHESTAQPAGANAAWALR